MLAIAAVLNENDDEEIYARLNQTLFKRFIRDAGNAFEMGAESFRRHYRMFLETAIELIELLRPNLMDHPRGVRSHLQVLCVIRFLAEGSYQKGISQDANHPMAQSTFSKYLHKVIAAINLLAEQFIVFPRTRVEREAVETRFRERIGFPGVLGAIDCTLPRVHTPSEHEEAYVNHHQDHSFNVQMVSDMDYNIMDIRICNGCTNDQFIWNHSHMRDHMYQLKNDVELTAQEGRYYLIGDNGYTPSTVLLTADVYAAPGTPELRYSDHLRRTRCVIEQTFGVWKEVFRCLHDDRTLHYKSQFAAKIILACAVLYNFLRHRGVPMPVPPRFRCRQQPNHQYQINNEYIEGLRVRQQIINTYFHQ